MNCPHCGTNVSPQAAACPQCGHPFADPSRPIQQGIQREKTSESLSVLAFLAVCTGALIVGNAMGRGWGIGLLLLGSVFVWLLYRNR